MQWSALMARRVAWLMVNILNHPNGLLAPDEGEV